ncbi:hypothetical protein N7462_000995 [Penicillium macrosclerotiorum]|uniref:uncharacterized protein n=1 Tax=Penicillium macrosclerotiorum TaxID=303699 RepID=UPI0025468E3A|nr:uncharacterized protein N7462_000995 [Penicillium macrosclerotiorum]KAJ5698990.1 hypothetical protein N7462_000995 [Penicillium macrosclerotiorum]
MATSKKNIVILGGSFGGISTAHYLLKHAIPKLASPETYHVVLVSASPEAICRPACPRAMLSDKFFNQEKLFVSIPGLFEQYSAENFHFEHATVINIDHENRVLQVKFAEAEQEKSIDFHALVIATGASTVSPLFGLNKDAASLRAAWALFREALPTAKRIVIAGGGPTGVETAGELGEYLNGRAWWFSSKLDSPKVQITLVTSGDRILPHLRPSLAQKAEGLLARVGVTVIKGTKVVSVEPANAGTADSLVTKATVTLADDKTIEADIYIPAVGTMPNTGFVSKTLLASDGRIENNSSTLRVDSAGPRIYAIGDAASYARPAVHTTLNAMPVLCANLKRDLLLAAGTSEAAAGEDRAFKEDTRETQLVPIGTSKGVGAAMGFAIPSFLVWLIKGRDYWLWTTGDIWSGKQWAKES